MVVRSFWIKFVVYVIIFTMLITTLATGILLF
ncbi:stressosome-associated protein Prli42 [Desmospora activa]